MQPHIKAREVDMSKQSDMNLSKVDQDAYMSEDVNLPSVLRNKGNIRFNNEAGIDSKVEPSANGD